MQAGKLALGGKKQISGADSDNGDTETSFFRD